LPSILHLIVCFAADRIRPLRRRIPEVVHRATRLASSPPTLYAQLRLYSRSTDGSVRLRLPLSFPARSCLPHPSPPPRSLPGEHPSPYTCRASLHAPFWINASTLMWLLRVFSRQPPDKGRVLSYCDNTSAEEPLTACLSGPNDGLLGNEASTENVASTPKPNSKLYHYGTSTTTRPQLWELLLRRHLTLQFVDEVLEEDDMVLCQTRFRSVE